MESTIEESKGSPPPKANPSNPDENLTDDIEDKNQSYFDYSAGKNQSTQESSRSGGSNKNGNKAKGKKKKRSYLTQLFSRFSWVLNKNKSQGAKVGEEEESKQEKGAKQKQKQKSKQEEYKDFQSQLQMIKASSKEESQQKKVFLIDQEAEERVHQTMEDEYMSSSDEEGEGEVTKSGPILKDPQTKDDEQNEKETPEGEEDNESEEEEEEEEDYGDEESEEEGEEEMEEELEEENQEFQEEEEEEDSDFEDIFSCVHRLPKKNQYMNMSYFIELLEVQKVSKEVPFKRSYNIFAKWFFSQSQVAQEETKRYFAFSEGRLLTLKSVPEIKRNYGKYFEEEKEENVLPEMSWDCQLRSIRPLKDLVSVSFLNFKGLYNEIGSRKGDSLNVKDHIRNSDHIRLEMKWQTETVGEAGEVLQEYKVKKYLLAFLSLEQFVEDLRYHLNKVRNYQVKSILT